FCDHTSLMRLVERRVGVIEPNITRWRPTVTGDLTSTFNFDSPNAAAASLPSTASYQPADSDVEAGTRFPDYVPPVPANQALPEQEPGTRPARALPYELHVDGVVGNGGVEVTFTNSGKTGAAFHVRFENAGAPKTYTVGAGDETSDTIGGGGATYDFAVYGPNGFLRTFAGGFAEDRANLEVKASYDKNAEGI